MWKVKAAILTILLWLIGGALYCYWYINSNLALPISDAYANSVGFQLMMFVFFRLPFLLLILPIIIYIELIIIDLFIEPKDNS